MILILNILIGLIGLGIVVFFHELGHMIAAKRVGIDVEAFSLGWGKKLIGRKWRGTEYRISVFPIGGYVKMKGEHALLQAWENKADAIEKEPGSFFAAAWWKRIIVSLAGPLANLVLSIVILTFVYTLGYTFETFDNRVIVGSDYPELVGDTGSPAGRAGIQTGDRIVSVEGETVEHFQDLREKVAVRPDEEISISFLRDGRELTTTLRTDMDTATGAGVIGVFRYIEPVIESVEDGSPADRAGLEPGDRIVSANGQEIEVVLDLTAILADNPGRLDVEVLRDGQRRSLTMEPDIGTNGQPARIGVMFAGAQRVVERFSLPVAFARGIEETFRTFALTLRSIRLLFQGVDATTAVSGPVRITVLVGEVATQGFSLGIGAGLSALFSFLSLLSVALAFMNLLPIPVLDGGQILLFLVEGIRRRPLKPKVVYRYQVIGSIIVFALLAFAVFSDVLFFVRR